MGSLYPQIYKLILLFTFALRYDSLGKPSLVPIKSINYIFIFQFLRRVVPSIVSQKFGKAFL